MFAVDHLSGAEERHTHYRVELVGWEGVEAVRCDKDSVVEAVPRGKDFAVEAGHHGMDFAAGAEPEETADWDIAILASGTVEVVPLGT